MKKINEIKIYEDVAYLASSFGIIELDIANLEIKNSFQIDSLFSSVNDVIVYSDTILASSENGLYAASINSNLSDYNSWKMIDSRNCEKMISKGEEIYISFTNNEKDSVFVLQNNIFLTINKEFNEVLIEAGPNLNGAFLNEGLIDEIIVYLAPSILGNSSRGMFELPLLNELSESFRFYMESIDQIGTDLRIVLRK